MSREADPGLLEDITTDVAETLERATAERWGPDELMAYLAGMIFCAYRTKTIAAWLEQHEYRVPRIRFQNHIVDHAAREVVGKWTRVAAT